MIMIASTNQFPDGRESSAEILEPANNAAKESKQSCLQSSPPSSSSPPQSSLSPDPPSSRYASSRGTQLVARVLFPTEVETEIEAEVETETETETKLSHGLRDIEAFYGHDVRTGNFAVRYKGDDIFSLTWLHRDQLHNTDPRWLEIAQKHGMPSKDRNAKNFRALKGGVLTRAQRMKVVTGLPGTTGIYVPQQSPGELRCLSSSYLNLTCKELSDPQKAVVRELELSETQLAEKLCRENYPVRMTHPRWFTGVPRKPGDYLVSLSAVHTDGLRVLPGGALRFFPSDPTVSKCVLTEEHPYVRENLIERKDKYQAIRLIPADKPKLTKQQKRARDRKCRRERGRDRKRVKMS